MKIIFRVDASLEIGSGHLIRCLTLAEGFRSRGHEVAFISRDMAGEMSYLFEDRGFRHQKLSRVSSINLSQREDAFESIVVIQKLFPDGVNWVVVDSYSLDCDWENIIKSKVHHIMVIDDIANRVHNCEILIDQNYEDKNRYRKLIPKHSLSLLGPKFALLRPEYVSYRNLAEIKKDVIKNKAAFIFFGGSDQYNLTGKAIRALSSSYLNSLFINVVVGANYLYYDELVKLANQRGNVEIHKNRTHLADLMAESIIAVGGGGVTNWERICMGLPSIVISLAGNQVPICEILNSKGIIHYLGKSETVSIDHIHDAVWNEIQTGKLKLKNNTTIDLCDGLGVDRVVSEITKYHILQ